MCAVGYMLKWWPAGYVRLEATCNKAREII
jgi:hypothetical protein